MVNAEFGEGIEDSVHASGRGGNRPSLAAALYAKGIVQAGKAIPGKVERCYVVSSWQGIVHERAREKLPGFRVVESVLQERLTETLGDSAMHLTIHQAGIDDSAKIVDGSIALHRDHACIRIDSTSHTWQPLG